MVESLPTLTQPQIGPGQQTANPQPAQMAQLVQDVGTGTPTPKGAPYIHTFSFTGIPWGFPHFLP